MSRDPGTVLVEACVDSAHGALAAARLGARRLELCAGLLEGGTTPSVGMIAAVRARVAIPVVVMIRPRGGDFLYSSDELEIMERDVATARALGADGVALGVLTPEGAVHAGQLRALVRSAQPLPVTFHRAVDATADLAAALETIIDAGARRVLTSGGAPSAHEGLAAIASLVQRANGRIAIMAGGGVTGAVAASLVCDAGVRELHVGGLVAVPSAMRFRRAGITFVRPAPPDAHAHFQLDETRLHDVVVEAGQARGRA